MKRIRYASNCRRPAGAVRFHLFALAICIFFSGCAHYQKISLEKKEALYDSAGKREINRPLPVAPAFLVYNYLDPYNRIGTPSAAIDPDGREFIFVDDALPTIYVMERTFKTANGIYTNLFYRVHFPRVPYSLIPFHLTAGRNTGLMVIVTLNALHQVVLVSTVHTCGCYLAIIPTSYLPQDARPDGWQNRPLRVYGETLPGQLDFKGLKRPKLIVHIRPATHRVMNVEVIDGNTFAGISERIVIQTPTVDMEILDKIPLNGRTTSFYYQDGLLKGHVKGSVKPFESLLLSLVSLDLFVGTDKIYADSTESGNVFYTSLKPWNRQASDMWEFERFLNFWGWRL